MAVSTHRILRKWRDPRHGREIADLRNSVRKDKAKPHWMYKVSKASSSKSAESPYLILLPSTEALGIAYPAKGTFWTTRGIPPIWPDELVSAEVNSQGLGNEDYLVWVQYVLAQKSIPYVISTSYDDDEQTVPFVRSRRSASSTSCVLTTVAYSHMLSGSVTSLPSSEHVA